MKELLKQIQQRTEKLLDEVEKRDELQGCINEYCSTDRDYEELKEQKEYVEFLTMKLKTSVSLLDVGE